MMFFETDDLRQVYVVAKNEMLKFVSGRKFTVYVALVTLVFLMITLLPYVFGGNLGETPGDVLSSYVTFIPLLIILAATLFASVTIVSEYEERTALILFTRPIKKTSVFAGKVVACMVLESVMIIVFYGAMTLATAVAAGVPEPDILVSLGFSLLYVFAASSVAVFMSSVMKKGSTAAILTFILLLLLIPIVTTILSASGIDSWFMLDSASDAISLSIPEYVDQVNEMISDMQDQLGVSMEDMMVSAPDMPRAAATLVAWGAAALAGAWAVFTRREF